MAAATFVEIIFDATMGVFILTFAFTQGVFPKPPDFAKLGAFDLSFFAGHPRFLLFVLTVLAALGLAGLRAAVAPGAGLLGARAPGADDPARPPALLPRGVARPARGWGFRFTAFWFLLDAFNIGGSVKNVLLVLGVNAVAAAVPFTPGGAGVQQAFLVKVFAGTASGATVAAYSVGQQIAIASFTLGIGFVALWTIFQFRSFKDVIAAGRADREGGGPPAGEGATAGPGAPRARA